MEMVLRLRKQGMGEIRWERGGRVCLLLALSGILYCGVGMDSADYMAKTEDTVVYGQEIKQNGSMCGGYTEDICKHAKKTFALYDWEQGNAAAHRLAEQQRHIGITERVKRPEIRETSMTQDFRVLSEISQKRETPVIENISMIENAPFVGDEEEIKNNLSAIEEEKERDTPYVKEETGKDGSFIENEEVEDDMSFVQDGDVSTGDGGEIREIAGFIVDSQGYITGVTGDLVLMDGVLAVSAEPECIGIKADAFLQIEEEVIEIYIPANICDIEQGAFDCFPFLMYIEASQDHSHYYSEEGILYSVNGEEIAYPTGR